MNMIDDYFFWVRSLTDCIDIFNFEVFPGSEKEQSHQMLHLRQFVQNHMSETESEDRHCSSLWFEPNYDWRNWLQSSRCSLRHSFHRLRELSPYDTKWCWSGTDLLSVMSLSRDRWRNLALYWQFADALDVVLCTLAENGRLSNLDISCRYLTYIRPRSDSWRYGTCRVW
jgi:hypothetical protein